MLSDMSDRVNSAIAILDRLISFPSLPGKPNLDLIGYVRDYLAGHGIECFVSHDATGTRANLHAVIGPPIEGGVALNGHTDVVPADGQAWSSDPFRLTRRDDRLYGRGAVDMKGFLACMLAAAPMFRARNLARPVHLTFCYDEEIGGLGAPVLVADMAARGPLPAVAIVGEPTAMQIVAGHKGGCEMRTEITGLEGHASDPRKGVNAIFAAARFVAKLEEMGKKLAGQKRDGSPFDPPFSTISVGTIRGGAARNIIAGQCALEWELRPMPGDDAEAILAEIEQFARGELLAEMRTVAPAAAINIIEEARVPALDPTEAAVAVALIRKMTGLAETRCVSFGTDAGYFCRAGISTAVFGPGGIERAHKPDEFIAVDELAACLAYLERLADHLAT